MKYCTIHLYINKGGTTTITSSLLFRDEVFLFLKKDVELTIEVDVASFSRVVSHVRILITDDESDKGGNTLCKKR